MNYLVYIITCVTSNKSYVGVTNNLQRRMRDHRSPRSSCKALYNAISCHGWDNFEVKTLVNNLSRQEAYELEPLLIEEHGTRIPNGYNITGGGWNGRVGMTYVMTEEHKRKISLAKVGTKHTEETKQRIRDIKSTTEYKERDKRVRETVEYKERVKQSRETSEAVAKENARRKTAEYREQARRRRVGIPHSESRITNIQLGLLEKNLADFDAGKISGVSLDKRSTVRPWVARMRHNGKTKYLGCFATEEEAKVAYRAALVDLIECSRAS